jgi:putative tryptophan/tyrosine transport system substrate-binding protein
MSQAIRVRRRQLLAALGYGASAAGLALLGGCAPLARQSPPPMPLIGYLHTIVASDPGSVRAVEAFREGLREQGLVEGQNLRIEWRFAEGQNERVPALATELIGLGVRLIVAGGATAPSIVRQLTDRVPIVLFNSARDPVAQGFAVSLARPGGNVTGTAGFGTDLDVKVVQQLLGLVPTARRVAHMTNLTAPASREVADDLAQRLTQELLVLDIQRPEHTERAFEQAQQWGAEALYVRNIVPLNTPRDMVPTLAARARLPAVTGAREWVEAGLLMSYNVDTLVAIRRTAWYVARILNGDDPAELPIERPSVFEFVINRTALANLGLVVPAELAAQVIHWVT